MFGEVLGGVRYTDLDLTMASGTARGHDHLANLSPAIGAGMGVRIAESLLLDLRFLADLNGKGGVLRSRDLDLSYGVTPNAGITVGYRRWVYAEMGDNESNIDRLVWSGFSGGFTFCY